MRSNWASESTASRLSSTISTRRAAAAFDVAAVGPDRSLCSGATVDGRHDDELAALACAGAVRGDRAAVHFDQALDEGESKAEPRPLACARVTLVEHLEQVRELLGGDAAARVPDAYLYLRPRRARLTRDIARRAA